jgi:hypothetical protein
MALNSIGINDKECLEFCKYASDQETNRPELIVDTAEGIRTLSVGDYILEKGGKFYCEKGSIFEDTYRLAFVPECSYDCGHTDCNCGYQPVSNGEVGTSPKGIGADRYKKEDESLYYIRRNTPSVKAIFYDGKNIEQVKDFLKEHYIVTYAKDSNISAEYENTESLLTANIDNYCVIPKNRWVVLEQDGNIYPVSRDIFELTFIHKLGGSNV